MVNIQKRKKLRKNEEENKKQKEHEKHISQKKEEDKRKEHEEHTSKKKEEEKRKEHEKNNAKKIEEEKTEEVKVEYDENTFSDDIMELVGEGTFFGSSELPTPENKPEETIEGGGIVKSGGTQKRCGRTSALESLNEDFTEKSSEIESF